MWFPENKEERTTNEMLQNLKSLEIRHINSNSINQPEKSKLKYWLAEMEEGVKLKHARELLTGSEIEGTK